MSPVSPSSPVVIQPLGTPAVVPLSERSAIIEISEPSFPNSHPIVEPPRKLLYLIRLIPY